MESVVDLCATSSSSTSGTSTPAVKGHVRRSLRGGNSPQGPPEGPIPAPKRPRAAAKPEKLWSVPLSIDFDSENETPVTQREIEEENIKLTADEADQNEGDSFGPAIKETQTTTSSSNSQTPSLAFQKFVPKPFVAKKTSPTFDPNTDFANFFCKANPQSVLKLVDKAVEAQEQKEQSGEARKRKWTMPTKPKPVSIKEDELSSSKDDQEVKIGKEIEDEPKPSWAALIDEERPKIIGRKSLDRPPVAEVKTSTATAASTTLSIPGVELDPGLRAALNKATVKPATETPAVPMPFEVHVAARLTQDAAAPEYPFGFKISSKSTFGQIKSSYCQTRKLSPSNLVLTHKDTLLFDSVVISASKIVPDFGSDKLHLVLYDRAVLDHVKAEQARSKADIRSILAQQEAATESLDVSAYMQDAPTSSTQDSDVKILIKIQAGRNICEAFRIASNDTLENLLEMYSAKYPEANKARSRFHFDGAFLNLKLTIEEAELEDGDLIELRAI